MSLRDCLQMENFESTKKRSSACAGSRPQCTVIVKQTCIDGCQSVYNIAQGGQRTVQLEMQKTLDCAKKPHTHP